MRCQVQRLVRVGEASVEMSLMLENTGKGSRSCVWRLQGMLQGQAGLARESRTVGSPGDTSFGEVGAPAPLILPVWDAALFGEPKFQLL